MALDLPDCCPGQRSAAPPVHRPNCRSASFDVREAHGDDRISLERFIAARFAFAYDARISHFCRHLLGAGEVAGAWHAAAGYTPARCGPLFVEHYLGVPIEQVLSGDQVRPVDRDDVVEVGNLAATSAGSGRALVAVMGRHLHRCGFVWVVFTATRELRNSFGRLGLPLARIARADPARLPDRGESFGRYYDHDPMVVAGDLSEAARRGLLQ
jgi:Thermostable hemolysin